MAGGRTLKTYLVGDGSDFRNDMDRNSRSAQGFAGKMRGIGSSLKSFLGPALAGAGIAAGAFAIKLGVDGVQGAIEDRAEQEKLAAVLDKVRLAHRTDEIEEWIDAQARATKFTDSDLRPAYGKLVDKTKDVEEAQRLMGIAMGIAAETGKPLDTVVNALIKSADGALGPIKKLAPGVKELGDKSATTEERIDALDQRFGDMATKMATSDAAQIEEAGQAVEELQESFGEGFLNGIGNAQSGVGELADTIYDLRDEMEQIGEKVGTLAAQIVPAVTAFSDLDKNIRGVIDTVENSGTFGEAFILALQPPLAAAQSFLAVLQEAKKLAQELGIMDQDVQSLTYGGADGSPGARPSTTAVDYATGTGSRPSPSAADYANRSVVNIVKVEAGVSDPDSVARKVAAMLASRGASVVIKR